ncbi:hypothetical protein [Methanofollis sp. UBA420]
MSRNISGTYSHFSSLLKQLEKEVECGETIEESKTGSVSGAP